MSEEKAKPGPKGVPKWGTITKEGIIVGREGRVVPPDEIEHLASLGCTDREIAKYFNLSESTLRYNFSEYLTKGRHQLRITLRQAQLRVAIEGNPTMLIWLGKNILQQTDQGMFDESKRPLPWTDSFDDDAVEEQDEETQIYDESQEQDGI